MPGRIIAGQGSAGRTIICVDGREADAKKNSGPITVNRDDLGPEEGARKEGGASCERLEPDNPERAIGEGMIGKGAEDEGAEVAAATRASKEEARATAGEGYTICAAGGWTGWASYALVRERPGGRACMADVKQPKKMGTISAHSDVIYGRQMGHM